MREDLDHIFDDVLRFAMQQVREHGEFYPFGSALKTLGGYEAVNAWTGTDYPASDELTAALIGAFRTQVAAGEIRAFGLCRDMRMRAINPSKLAPSEPGSFDAIVVDLESQAECARVVVPYRRDAATGDVEFGEFIREKYEPVVFTVPHKRPWWKWW